jgi:hypothetical protein
MPWLRLHGCLLATTWDVTAKLSQYHGLHVVRKMIMYVLTGLGSRTGIQMLRRAALCAALNKALTLQQQQIDIARYWHVAIVVNDGLIDQQRRVVADKVVGSLQ